MLGLFLVLLPVLLPFWHEVVQRWGFTAWVFEEFSRMGPVALGWLLFLFVGLYGALRALARHSPGGWDVARQWGFPSPAQVVDRGFVPRAAEGAGVFLAQPDVWPVGQHPLVVPAIWSAGLFVARGRLNRSAPAGAPQASVGSAMPPTTWLKPPST